MKKLTAHRCKNCNKTYTPFQNGANGEYGPECVKQFVLAEIADIQNSGFEVSPEDLVKDKAHFDAMKHIDDFSRSLDNFDSKKGIPEDAPEIIQTNMEILNIKRKEKEMQEVAQFLEMTKGKMSVKQLVIATQSQNEVVSNLASAIFTTKLCDKISHNIIQVLPPNARLMLAKNIRTSKAVLNDFIEGDYPLDIKNNAKMTLNIKKQMEK